VILRLCVLLLGGKILPGRACFTSRTIVLAGPETNLPDGLTKNIQRSYIPENDFEVKIRLKTSSLQAISTVVKICQVFNLHRAEGK